MLLKSKLTQRDLDEVLRLLKANDHSMSGFAQYENSSASLTSSDANNNGSSQKERLVAADKSVFDSSGGPVDLDSTLVVADNSASNLNTSTWTLFFCIQLYFYKNVHFVRL